MSNVPLFSWAHLFVEERLSLPARSAASAAYNQKNIVHNQKDEGTARRGEKKSSRSGARL